MLKDIWKKICKFCTLQGTLERKPYFIRISSLYVMGIAFVLFVAAIAPNLFPSNVSPAYLIAFIFGVVVPIGIFLLVAIYATHARRLRHAGYRTTWAILPIVLGKIPFFGLVFSLVVGLLKPAIATDQK